MIKPFALLSVSSLFLSGCLPTSGQDAPEPAAPESVTQAPAPKTLSDDVVAQVNGVDVRAAQGMRDLNEVINLEIIAQKARNGGLPSEHLAALQADIEGIERRVLAEALQRKMIDQTVVSDEEVAARYQSLIEAQDPHEYKFRFAKFDTNKDAQDSIDAVAKSGTVDPETYQHLVDSESGEDREWTTLNTLPPMFASLLPSLGEKATTATPIPSNQGYFVVFLEAKRDRNFPALEKVKNELIVEIKKERLREKMTQLREEAVIRIR